MDKKDMNEVLLDFIYELSSAKTTYNSYIKNVLMFFEKYFEFHNSIFFYNVPDALTFSPDSTIPYEFSDISSQSVEKSDVFLDSIKLNLSDKELEKRFLLTYKNHLLRFNQAVMEHVPEKHYYKFVILDSEFDPKYKTELAFSSYITNTEFTRYAVLPIYIKKVLVGAIYLFDTGSGDLDAAENLEAVCNCSRYIKAGMKEIALYTESVFSRNIYNNLNLSSPIANIIIDCYRNVIFANRMASDYCEDICSYLDVKDGSTKSANETKSPIDTVISKVYENTLMTNGNSIHTINVSNAIYTFSTVSFISSNISEKLQTYYMIYIMKVDNQISISLQYISNKYNLTSREVSIIQLIEQGFKNSDIADQLFISRNTVKVHISNIFRKMNVQNRTALVYKLKESRKQIINSGN